MRDADRARQPRFFNLRRKIRDSLDAAHAARRTVLQYRDTARVVAAILEAAQSLGENRNDVALRHCSYYSAHGGLRGAFCNGCELLRGAFRQPGARIRALIRRAI